MHDAIYAKFAEKLFERVAALRIGPATREVSQIGPMINSRAVDKIESHVQDALPRGGKLLTGGKRVKNDIACGPNYFAPTVIAEANHNMALASKETFGPVVPLFRLSSEDEVVRLANDTPFGLAAYFYSRDVSRVAERLQPGIVGINEGALASEAAPFGGVKESGYGREDSRYGLEDYMQAKYQCQGGMA